MLAKPFAFLRGSSFDVLSSQRSIRIVECLAIQASQISLQCPDVDLRELERTSEAGFAILVEAMLDNGGSEIIYAPIKDHVWPEHLSVVSGRHIVKSIYDDTSAELATFLPTGSIGDKAFLTGCGS
jgi:hypothetical protein